MSEIEQRLAEMRGRSEKATPGPWEPSHWVPGQTRTVNAPPLRVDGRVWPVAERVLGRDAEFIAHARTDLDDLRGAVEDVLAHMANIEAIAGQPIQRYDAIREVITARLGGA
jgi:hypothetical protein